MKEVGLQPDERLNDPKDEEISDLITFLCHLTGQLSGLKVLIDIAKESSRLEEELGKMKAELATAKERSADLKELWVAGNRAS